MKETDLPDFCDLTMDIGQEEALLNEEKYAGEPLVVSDSINLHNWFE